MTKNTRQDLTAAVALAAYSSPLCSSPSAARTPRGPDAGRRCALDVPVGSPMMVADGGGVRMMVQPTLTLDRHAGRRA